MSQRLVDRLVRRVPWTRGASDPLPLVEREWLVTNGLGGYASGTVVGVTTRRYHGLLVAALPNPLGRQIMLTAVRDTLRLADGTEAWLGGAETGEGALEAPGAAHLDEFVLEAGLPVWRYRVGDARVEKRILMPHGQNSAHVTWRLLEGTRGATLSIEPQFHHRGYEDPVSRPIAEDYRLATEDGAWVVSSDDSRPAVRLAVAGEALTFTEEARRIAGAHHRVERHRGYDHTGELWSPGRISALLPADGVVALVASTESPEVMTALGPEEVRWAEMERRRRLLSAAASAHPLVAGDVVAAELVLAADQFIVTPNGRRADHARARAVGDEVRTVIAGYHWFTDWGRDTMISLEGLTLSTGRFREAGFILRTFAHYVRDGLIPNMFPDGSNEGLYHTADATLWFFHAVDRYVRTTGDTQTLVEILPVLRSIVDAHLRGTHYGIRIDPADGLMTQGQEGYQLTWMDAKVDGWVVTPRRGKAVELNALWYNAVRLLEGWLRDRGDERAATELAVHAAKTRASFNARFWYEGGGYCYDVVDGPDGDSTECRPNQLFAIALTHPVLDGARWRPVVEVARTRLLTPVGLRSLAPGSPNYAPRYDGDLRARDGAYHQGTVWGWLIGPWVDAWLRVHPEDRGAARQAVASLVAAMDGFGVGSIAEIFDAEPPYTPRGCIAQAWSVAEALRCWLKTAPDTE